MVLSWHLQQVEPKQFAVSNNGNHDVLQSANAAGVNSLKHKKTKLLTEFHRHYHLDNKVQYSELGYLFYICNENSSMNNFI